MQAKGGGQEWYYHAPSPKMKTEKQFAPAASQIPGLSDVDKEAMERETGTNKRNWLRDSDSKYVQLAKQGGRRNLLTFNAKVGEGNKPKPYPRVDWFDHVPMTTEEEKKILAERQWNPPEYMVHEAFCEPEQTNQTDVNVDLGQARREGRDIQNKYEGRGVPFHTDDKSVWRRHHDDANKSSSLDTVKLPEINKKETIDGTEFSKLMSGGYGDEWIKSRAVQQKKKIKKWESQNTGTGSGLYNLTEYQQNISKREIPRKKLKPIVYTQRIVKEEKEAKIPFKLSRFTNIPPKLNTGSVRS